MGFSMKEQNAFILFWFSSHPLSVSVVDSMAAASAGLQRYYGNNIDIQGGPKKTGISKVHVYCSEGHKK